VSVRGEGREIVCVCVRVCVYENDEEKERKVINMQGRGPKNHA
jgi:hypothetical protein